MNVQADALRKTAWAIESFLSSVSSESDNYAGGVGQLNLEEALSLCKQALGAAGAQSVEATGVLSEKQLNEMAGQIAIYLQTYNIDELFVLKSGSWGRKRGYTTVFPAKPGE